MQAMASRFSARGEKQLVRVCSVLLPVFFTSLAIWFFAFLIQHSVSPQLLQTAGSASAHIDKHPLQPNRSDNGSLEPFEAEELEEVSALSSTSLSCNLAWGRWIHDKNRKHSYSESCREIFKGWNCLRNNKSNARDILTWRWQPWDCDLPQMNAALFLKRFKNKKIGFVGDSLNRNMYSSFVCSLRQVSQQVRKWRPVGADKALTFLDYNVTVAYHRTNLLARYAQWEAKEYASLFKKWGYMKGYRVDVDVPQSTWADAPLFHDVLVLNTGHWWWSPGKFDPVKSPMVFFEKGRPIIPPKSPEEGIDIVLKNMLAYVEQRMPVDGLMFLRSQSPRHFEGGDWNEGGKCHRSKPLEEEEAKAWFTLSGNPGPNMEMSKANMHLEKAVRSTKFELLNISYLSSLRAEAHPSQSAGKVHEDCMHWCLPGVADTWNDILVSRIFQNLQDSSNF